MEIVQGKHFSITDPQGVNTVIYKVNETEKEYLKESPKYTIERLDYSEELRGDVKKKTFFVDEPKEEEDLVILSFGKDRVVVNMGILQDNKVVISKVYNSGELIGNNNAGLINAIENNIDELLWN